MERSGVVEDSFVVDYVSGGEAKLEKWGSSNSVTMHYVTNPLLNEGEVSSRASSSSPCQANMLVIILSPEPAVCP